MTLYLVRHAKAGQRSDWHGPDRDRPLTKPGRRQAAAIAAHLALGRPPALLSSPYVRCRQTLAPLGDLVGIEVVDDLRLAEGRSFGPVLDLLAAAADGTVLCSHGDVIPDTMQALERRGCRFDTPADWRKGSVWSLERVDGEIVRAAVWVPGD
jgi:8-oxo-dGTP diphosphatase